jgi:hypothetical protein
LLSDTTVVASAVGHELGHFKLVARLAAATLAGLRAFALGGPFDTHLAGGGLP